MSRIFEIPIIYTNKGIPPRHRTSRGYTVFDTALLSFPEAPTSELEPALTFRHVYRLTDDVEDKTHDTVIHQYAGHLVRPMDGSSKIWSEEKMSLDILARLSLKDPGQLPKGIHVPSNRTRYGYRSEAFEARDLKAKHISESGRQAAIDELQAHIDATMVLVDGILYAHAPDPRHNVWVQGDGVKCHHSLIRQGMFSFPADCGHLAEEFTAWACEEYGLEMKDDGDTFLRRNSFILDHHDIPFSGNPIVESALEFADRAELNIVNTAAYGEETKRLGIEFRADPTMGNALAFMDAFEEAVTGGGYPDARYSGNKRDFTVFRKFFDTLPEEYKLGFSNEIALDISWSPTMGS